ncbi:hypothetical protein Pfo_012214 [Paulownia fortunei]|nr:hypothetical protein Pfo_012214 [Paulownia fortunei]
MRIIPRKDLPPKKGTSLSLHLRWVYLIFCGLSGIHNMHVRHTDALQIVNKVYVASYSKYVNKAYVASMTNLKEQVQSGQSLLN